jgi:hypothetical protein
VQLQGRAALQSAGLGGNCTCSFWYSASRFSALLLLGSDFFGLLRILGRWLIIILLQGRRYITRLMSTGSRGARRQ